MRVSDFELEVLQVFWQHGELTAPEVHSYIASSREVAYNTVKTIIDRLEKKGALKRVRQFGRTLLFQVQVEQKEIVQPMVRGFLDRLFQGDRQALMSQLFQEEELSEDEVAYLEEIIRATKKGTKK